MMLEYLRKEGFMPVEESFGLAFRYQMKNFLFLNNDEDPSFFQLVMPGICDVNDGNRLDVYRAMDAMNASKQRRRLCRRLRRRDRPMRRIFHGERIRHRGRRHLL